MEAQPKRKILLVDDDTSLLVTLGDFLGFEGYEVRTADSGEAALKLLEDFAPDLIILDMSMPGMGGVGFLKKITGPEGKLRYPVLVLTARAGMAEFFANVEVDGFIAKPCDPHDLLLEVGRILFLRAGGPRGNRPFGGEVRRRILLGEDDVAINRRLVRAFAAAGYLVESATKGPDVLEKAIVSKPDVIVMKLCLAGMNGDEVAELLHKLPTTSSTPILIYDDTGTPLPKEKLIADKTGIRMFVHANDAESLLQAVKAVL
ncbi:MAG: response regulator [Kiritimatiellae bacterium]|nr:response regulator [Kiritimatiellia bacterium]